ncbi:MAG TPA: hypothetical protein VMJ64_05345 [Anaerolineales bacterium]|nr:hypothetical protein [Anaerolineales bacterium]
MNLKWFQRGIIILIIAASLYASVQNLLATRSLGSVSDDPVADWEKRFAQIKAKIPFERGVIGYISDANVPGASYDAANDEGEYVLTQYVLAPLIIKRGTSQEWNIANLDKAAFAVWSKTNGSRFEVTPFKGGLYLLHRAGS